MQKRPQAATSHRLGAEQKNLAQRRLLRWQRSPQSRPPAASMFCVTSGYSAWQARSERATASATTTGRSLSQRPQDRAVRSALTSRNLRLKLSRVWSADFVRRLSVVLALFRKLTRYVERPEHPLSAPRSVVNAGTPDYYIGWSKAVPGSSNFWSRTWGFPQRDDFEFGGNFSH